MLYLFYARVFFNKMFIRIFLSEAERIIYKPDDLKFNRLPFKKITIFSVNKLNGLKKNPDT